MIAGTPQYMSPNKLAQKRSIIGATCSVLAVSCMPCVQDMLLSSRIQLQRLAIDYRQRDSTDSRNQPDVPEWLCRIINKLMAKQVCDRIESADQVAELLLVCLAHLQSPTTSALPAEFAKVKPERSASRFQQLLLGVFVMCCLFVTRNSACHTKLCPMTQTGPSKL